MIAEIFLKTSKVAVVPALLAEATAAAGLWSMSLPAMEQSLSINSMICPDGEAQYTGEPTISASASFNFAAAAFTLSVSGFQLGNLSINSIMIQCFATSLSAVNVQPSLRGLPFKSKTFMFFILSEVSYIRLR